MNFDIGTLNRLVERLNEKSSGEHKPTDLQREMIRKAKLESEQWAKQK